MNSPNYENHMAIVEQDNETHAEMKLREAKDIANEAQVNHEIALANQSGELNEFFPSIGMTRKDFLDSLKTELMDNINEMDYGDFATLTSSDTPPEVRLSSLDKEIQDCLDELRELGAE